MTVRSSSRICCVLLLLAAVVGCQTETVQPPRRGLPARTDGGLPGPLSLDDPCAERLHNLIGPILQYVVLNRQLPPTLEAVKPLADFDQPIDLTCPGSKESYVYVPAGLKHDKQTSLVIVHDAAPTHNGRRWCITMAPREPGQPIALEVIDVPEVFFRTYRPVE
jgi:hypothetical protein